MRLPAVLLALLLADAARAQDFEKAFATYRDWVRRPSLHKRTLARERLAETGDPRALLALVSDYDRPEKPQDQVRYLLAFIASQHFPEKETVDTLADWRARHDRPQDAWLWYQTLIPHIEARGPADLEAIARGDRNVFLRAAAIEALRFRIEGDPLGFIAGMAPALPENGLDRAVLLESLAALLASRRDLRTNPEFAAPAEALIRLMDDARTMPRTHIVMGRHLAKIFGVRYVWREAGRWLQELEFLRHGGKQASDRGYARPTFAGIEATGDRICYVIDMSDSMLEPLTPQERENLPRGPITGRAAAEQSRKEAKGDRWKRAFEAVKWDRVVNRFDAARELLKTSLLLLEEDQCFAVIGFGDDAEPLKSTRSMRKATLGNIRLAMQELDSFRPGPKKDDRPHGTLRGHTNMHGGFLLAFRMTDGRTDGEGEYVSGATFRDGCDTIFLLSDGAPTWDNWVNEDRKDDEDHAGDPELGGRQEDKDTLRFAGPYRRIHHLVADVRRLNLFRKVEIHCVGMGGADMNTLDMLARAGGGESLDLRRQ